MSKMMDILKEVDGLPISIVSDGADRQNEILCKELKFNVFKFKSGLEHNGWVVPQKWEVVRATIKKDGKLIYDGKAHPLGVIGYSESFSGKIKYEDLKEHLFYKKDSPNSIVYHLDLYYKQHKKYWGFSMPYNLYESLEPGEYDIDLVTEKSAGYMKVLEFTKIGKTSKTIVLNAHNCHTAQLNDGPAGYVVGIEVMNRLLNRETEFTYKLIIAPEHFGTVFYLSDMEMFRKNNFKYGIFLEMLGNDYPILALQETFSGNTELDRAASHYLKFNTPSFYQAPFRKIVGNDETVWEAAGIEVPMISLSRCQSRDFFYPEYHLDADNIKIMRPDKLEEAADIVLGIIKILETNSLIGRKFDGLIALSNPKYDLYIGWNDPSIDNKISDAQRNWNYLMDCLPRYFNKELSILDIAIKHGVSYFDLYTYLLKFKDKGLIEFIKSR